MEILIVTAQVLILAVFAALIMFYGLVFWYWRNDAKKIRAPQSKSAMPKL
jgi:cbb3-type cytochrome oxidase subunit 3